MSMLTQTYQHKSQRKFTLPLAITRLTANLMCGQVFNLVVSKHTEEFIHDTECPYCYEVSLNKTNSLNVPVLLCSQAIPRTLQTGYGIL